MAGPDADALKPHQKRLAAHLAVVPAEDAGQVTSNLPGDPQRGNPVFQTLTGISHEGLLVKWKTDRTTTCNDFCTHCAIAMGFTAKGRIDSLGKFDIADWLTRYGLGHCWVPANSGGTPAYGDIFRLYASEKDQNGVSLNHMGVSLTVAGTKWKTVEGGQGGPTQKFDAVARKERIWKPASLQGWVNVEAVIAAGAVLPYWLGGWWEITEPPYDTWYYYFGADGLVKCTSTRPMILTAPPAGTVYTGSQVITRGTQIEISWHGKDPNELLTIYEEQIKDKPSKFTIRGTKQDALKQPILGKRMVRTGVL